MAEPLTTVANVRGLSPELWMSNPQHVYVGRWVGIRSGRYAGQAWPRSPFANMFPLPKDATRQDRERCLELFTKHIAEQSLLRNRVGELIGKVLGCWCVTWDGLSQPMPLCHACVWAKLANELRGKRR